MHFTYTGNIRKKAGQLCAEFRVHGGSKNLRTFDKGNFFYATEEVCQTLRSQAIAVGMKQVSHQESMDFPEPEDVGGIDAALTTLTVWAHSMRRAAQERREREEDGHLGYIL